MVYDDDKIVSRQNEIKFYHLILKYKQIIMGSGESKETHSTQVYVNNPTFQNAKVVTLDHKRVLQNHQGGVQKKQYDRWQSDFQKRNIQNDQFLFLPLKHSYSSEGMCSSNGIATLNYPDYPHVMSDQIEERKGKRQYFQEDELWYLLYAFSSSKHNMKSTQKIGDVRPQNVFINDKGMIKLSNILSWPGQKTNYQKAFESERSYLAPEEVKQLGTAKLVQKGESEMFSIGLTVLSAGVLEDFSNLYDIKLHTFNEDKLQRKLDEWRINEKYSEVLKSTVDNLCEIDPAKRFSSHQLWKLVQPHEEKIKSRQHFVIQNAPTKLHQQVTHLRSSIPLIMKALNSSKMPNSPSSINRQTVQNANQAESVYVPRPL